MSQQNGNGAKPPENTALEIQGSKKTTDLTVGKEHIEGLKSKFIVHLRTNGGIVSHALKTSGLSNDIAYRHQKTDPEFASAWQQALEFANDNLVAEAIRRGVKGELKYSMTKTGRRKAYREKSDTLLIFMIKRGDVRSKWKKRIIQAGNKALEAVREEGTASGLTEEQIRAIQTRIIREFDKIPLT